MSPEQATGDMQVGPATDTYALAAVLYELLTGEPPYTGTTAQAVLGRIIQGVPVSATALRRAVPPNVDAAIRKALEKLPADRFTGAQDFAKALTDPSFRHGEGATAGAASSPGLWRWAALGLAGSTTALAVALGLALTRPEPVRHVERFAAPFQPDQVPTFLGSSGYELSPDGTMLVYRHDPGTGQILMVRRWDELRATPVRDTEGASNPAVSPDGLELAFQQGADSVATPLLAEPGYDEIYPVISPDGRFIAYQTTETDRHEIYVRPFPT